MSTMGWVITGGANWLIGKYRGTVIKGSLHRRTDAFKALIDICKVLK
jgi:hypothetical protein